MRLRAACICNRAVFSTENLPLARISGYSSKKPISVRISISWNTLSSRMPSRPATTTISINASQPAIHSAANGLEGVRSIWGVSIESVRAGRYRRGGRDLQRANLLTQRCAALNFAVGVPARSVLRIARLCSSFRGAKRIRNDEQTSEDLHMRILQPAEWSKPRGFSHGVEVDGPGKWIVLAGQTGGDEKGDYQ